MADTLQAVHWALGQTCPLRQGDAASDPCKALGAISHAATYARHLGVPDADGFGVFGDVCVTSYTYDPEDFRRLGPGHPGFPTGGFLVSEALKNVGGADGLVSMCAACPANTSWRRPAGCAGTLHKPPAAPETEAQVRRVIARLGIAEQVKQAFPQTRPLWYGLWARSPLSLPAARLLGVIVSGIHAEDAASADERTALRPGWHLWELRSFVRATEAAERHGLPLRVSMAPPGHSDFGIVDTFPHCPVCKAAAEGLPWRNRQSLPASYPCRACGTAYAPAETASAVRDRDDDERPHLRDVLGPERFARFARDYLVARGLTRQEADEMERRTEARDAERRRFADAARLKAERHNRYVTTVLFAGLHPVYERVYDNDDADEREPYRAAFPPAEFETLLTRCEQRNIKISSMSHRSESGEQDCSEFRVDDPRELLARWQRKGCRHLFGATFHVPDEALDETASG